MPRLRRRTALFVAPAAVALGLLTACTSTSAPPPSPAATAPATPMTPTTPAAPAGQAVLHTAVSPSLGTIVTDGDGHTLYRFDRDTTDPPASHCDGSCATLWPPVASDGHPQLTGVDPALVSTVTRADGTTQLTLAGSPLYRYAPDTKPGDTKGQGIQGIWWAVTPTGARATATASGTPGTGGY